MPEPGQPSRAARSVSNRRRTCRRRPVAGSEPASTVTWYRTTLFPVQPSTTSSFLICGGNGDDSPHTPPLVGQHRAQPSLRADPPEVSTPKTPDRERPQVNSAHAAPPAPRPAHRWDQICPGSRADTRHRTIRCGGQRTTRHRPAPSNSRSNRPVTYRASSTAHVRSCRIGLWPTAWPLHAHYCSPKRSCGPACVPHVDGHKVCVRLCASMPMTVIATPPRSRVPKAGGVRWLTRLQHAIS